MRQGLSKGARIVLMEFKGKTELFCSREGQWSPRESTLGRG